MQQLVGWMAIVLVVLSSCGAKKGADASPNALAGNKKLAAVLDSMALVESHHPHTLSFKSAVSFDAEGKNTSLKTYVRMVPDSAIWISISAYSLEVARILATPDSLKFVSKTEKKYYTGDYSFLTQKLGVKLGFDELQALLLGHSMGITNVADVQKRTDKEFYILSSHKKSEWRRLENGKPVNTDSEVAFSNWVNSQSYQVAQVSMFDMQNQHTAHINYQAFESIAGYSILSQMQLHIIAGKEIKVSTQNSKLVINEPVRFPFKISSKYEKMD